MSEKSPFDRYAKEYDEWFDEHEKIYRSELLAVEQFVPEDPGQAMEIGVGGGRFASGLGIREGVEPSIPMAEIATARGIDVKIGQSEDLPVRSSTCDLVTLITTICFVDDMDRTFAEAHRILREGGEIVVAFIPKNSTLGTMYRKSKDQDKFFKAANFYSTETVIKNLKRQGFCDLDSVQTLTGGLEEADRSIEPPSAGHDRGSFVVLRGTK